MKVIYFPALYHGGQSDCGGRKAAHLLFVVQIYARLVHEGGGEDPCPRGAGACSSRLLPTAALEEGAEEKACEAVARLSIAEFVGSLAHLAHAIFERAHRKNEIQWQLIILNQIYCLAHRSLISFGLAHLAHFPHAHI